MSKSVPLGEQAYEQLRQRIITLDLPPGAVLDEAQLQQEMGFGRTPIREAVKRLALENLVIIMPRRGMFVADIGVNDMQRLLEVRLVLETLAVRLAAQRGTEEHWSRLHALLDQPRSANSDDATVLIAADETFHEVIYDAADNTYLQDSLAVLLRLNERLWHHFLPNTDALALITTDHRAIAQSLEAGDAARAEALMVEHIRHVQERVRRQIIDEYLQE